MNVGSILRYFRKSENILQESLAAALNMSQNEVSRIETGKREITSDMIDRLMVNFKKAAVELKARYTFEKRSEFFSVPYLNGVDKHIQTVLDSLVEEMEEAIEAAEKLKRLCRNKSSRKDFSTAEWFELMDLMEQVVDPYSANKMLLTSMVEMYDLDIRELEERHLQKLVEKKYYRDDGDSLMAV